MILISVTDPNTRICRKSRKLPVGLIGLGLAAVLDFSLVTSNKHVVWDHEKRRRTGLCCGQNSSISYFVMVLRTRWVGMTGDTPFRGFEGPSPVLGGFCSISTLSRTSLVDSPVTLKKLPPNPSLTQETWKEREHLPLVH